MKTEIILLLTDVNELFGIKFLMVEDFLELLVRFFFNTLVILALVRYLYYPVARRKDYFFTYILVGTIIFMLCYALLNVPELSIGIALGLFALFGILRFRTIQIPIKEMTYLFLVIGISVINAMATTNTSYAELLLINTVFLFTAWSGERIWMLRAESTKTIVYEKIELIKPENQARLIEDLEERTGLKIKRVEIGRIDFMRDSARIRIHYSKEVDHNFQDDEIEEGDGF